MTAWNQSSLNLGSVVIGASLTGNATVISTGTNAGVTITKLGGNGTAFIDATPLSLGNLNNTNTTQVKFTCSQSSAQTPGYYEAVFNANSSNDNMGANITIGCTMVNASLPQIAFVPPTPDNGAITANTSAIMNISLNESLLSTFKWNWNGTNYTFYDSNLQLMLNLDNVSALGENATKAVDVSKSGKNGTIIGGATYTSSGKYGGAYTFNGSQYINFSSAATTVLDNWAIAAWMKPSTTSQLALVVYNGNNGASSASSGYGFGMGNGGAAATRLQGLVGNVGYMDSGYDFPTANIW